ncbi:unnamed protein product, partial [Tuber aestivum]
APHYQSQISKTKFTRATQALALAAELIHEPRPPQSIMAYGRPAGPMANRGERGSATKKTQFGHYCTTTTTTPSNVTGNRVTTNAESSAQKVPQPTQQNHALAVHTRVHFLRQRNCRADLLVG